MDKAKPIVHRIISILAVVFACVFFAVSILSVLEGETSVNSVLKVVLSGAAVLVSFIWLWLAFQVRYVEYHYNDKIVSIYAGFMAHTLRVDGKLADKHGQWLLNVNKQLYANLDNGVKIVVKIEPLNVVSFKVLGVKYKKK
jgi:hypothetical protein